MIVTDEVIQDRMGVLHNEIVHLVDATHLEPQDVLFVLRILIKEIADLHEIMLKKGNHGNNVEATSNNG